MNTAFLLMAKYDARPVLPLDVVCKDHFPHLQPHMLSRKVAAGEIKLPIVRMGSGQKATRGVHLADLAAYIDQQREQAQRELAA